MQDLQTLDLEPYQYSGVNFTGLRLIDPEDLIVRQTFNKHKNKWGLDDPSQLRVAPALMYDAVQLFARAFKQLRDATKADVKKLSCDGSDRWEHGLSLSNFMRSVRLKKNYFDRNIFTFTKDFATSVCYKFFGKFYDTPLKLINFAIY